MWHSAFVKWLIDPSSDLGLDTFPLKRFLYMIVYQGRFSNIDKEINLNITDIETMDLANMIFQNEYYFDNNGKRGRIDIIGIDDEIRLIIENKVKAMESNDQTLKYYDYGKDSSENHNHNLYVFLCPDESIIPKSDDFIQVSYQDLCDFVIKPCLQHPKLKQEEKYLLEQYLYNLSKPIKGGRVMALSNKDICEKIYSAHKEVLEEIFLSVKGETPQMTEKGNQIKTYEVTLTQLVKEDILDITDTLVANYKGDEYKADLTMEDEKIVIKFGGEIYKTLTSAGKAITKTNVNGWTFWSAEDKFGINKGSLVEIREKVLK